MNLLELYKYLVTLLISQHVQDLMVHTATREHYWPVDALLQSGLHTSYRVRRTFLKVLKYFTV